MEIVPPTKRVLAASAITTAYPVGGMLFGLVQYLTFDWRTSLRISYTPFLLALAFYWVVPESARWLLDNERHKEAANVLEKIAKMNGKKPPETLIQDLVAQKMTAKHERVWIIPIV